MGQVVQFPEARVSAGKEFRDAVLLGLSAPAEELAQPLLLRCARLRAVRAHHGTARILSDPHRNRPLEILRRGYRQAPSARRGRCRVRFRLEPEDRAPARRPGTPAAYIPIEISAAALYPAARRIARAFPGLGVHPILGGFHDLDGMKLPAGPFLCGLFPRIDHRQFQPHGGCSFSALGAPASRQKGSVSDRGRPSKAPRRPASRL